MSGRETYQVYILVSKTIQTIIEIIDLQRSQAFQPMKNKHEGLCT